MPEMKVSGDSEPEAEAEAGDAESVSGEDTKSGASSRGDRDSSAEEADEPDSDDSSEMDESECERRRNACLDNIANMERQFIILREQLFRERINQVEYQLAEVRGGRSQQYLGPLQQLQENMRMRIEVAGVLRQLRIDNIKQYCEAEELAAAQNLHSEKRLAFELQRDELQEKIRRLEEDRHAADVAWGDWTPARRAHPRSRRKPVTVSGPYVVYMLEDHDIMEDWTLIRKMLKRSSPKL